MTLDKSGLVLGPHTQLSRNSDYAEDQALLSTKCKVLQSPMHCIVPVGQTQNGEFELLQPMPRLLLALVESPHLSMAHGCNRFRSCTIESLVLLCVKSPLYAKTP